MVGCADLDVLPSSSIEKDQFYRTESDALTAVNGIYAILTNWPSDFHGMYNNLTVYLGDLTTEYVKAGANTNSAHIRELSNLAVQPNNDFMIAGWAESYIGINRANIVIDKLSDGTGDIPADTKERLVNEAKFLRALFYFNIVRWWGDVPLVLHDGDGEGEPRTPVDQVYAQIVKDLEDASGLPADFPGSTEGRATPGAALATLAKVYLTWAQTDSPDGKARQAEFYRQAIDYADRVIQSNRYRLVENVLDLFLVDKKNGPEHIFSVQHADLNNVTGHCTFAMGWSDSEPVLIVNDVKFYEEIDDSDQRKAGSFAKSLWNPNTNSTFTFKVPLFRKYIDTLNYAANQYAGRNTNNVYIRYAEVLLIKAEAENELNGPTDAAYDAINRVRRRGYRQFPLDTPSPVDLAGLSREAFREKLQAERFLEFVLEGQHWFDLVRWRRLVQTVRPQKPGVSAKNYLFPIPQEQLILNPNLKQNWGYEGGEGTNPYGPYEPGYTNE
jgi:hypothetical protein